jgi:hypothetical protein
MGSLEWAHRVLTRGPRRQGGVSTADAQTPQSPGLSPWMRRAAPGLRVLHPDGWSAGLGLAGNDPIK